MRRPKDARSGTSRALVDPELVERCRRGDEEAWADLVRVTYREVYTLCLRILRDPEEAADATQDAYLKAWRGLRSFRGEAAFGTWLYRVTTNAALSRLRSRSRRRGREVVIDEDLAGTAASSQETETDALARIDVGRLERHVASLPEHYRVAVVLRDVYGMSIEEVAAHAKISETAAKVRVHRARKKLKELMFATGDEEEGSFK